MKKYIFNQFLPCKNLIQQARYHYAIASSGWKTSQHGEKVTNQVVLQSNVNKENSIVSKQLMSSQFLPISGDVSEGAPLMAKITELEKENEVGFTRKPK